MTVNMVKFGDILISRPAGREAFLAAKAYLFTENAGLDSIILDFKGVKVLAPSWGDEFVTGLKSLYQNHIEAANIDSPAVKAALRVVLPKGSERTPRVILFNQTGYQDWQDQQERK